MSGEPIEPIEPGLGALFERERATSGPPEGSRARVRERLALSIAAAAAVTPALPSARPPWLKIVGAFVAGGVIGGVAVAELRPPRVVQIEKIVTVSAPLPSSAPPVPTEALVPPVPVRVPVPVPAPSSSSSAAVIDTLARERAILDAARTALGQGDAAAALESTQRHERDFARGQLTEEREAIAVQTLVKLGRRDDALARGTRFRKTYPNSVLLPAIDIALGK